MKEQEIISNLQQLGLSEKESRVYFATLEIGEATAQAIATKSGVNRSNTYIMIEALTKRGLMSSFQKGKKRFFIAGSPGQLLYIIEQAKQDILSKEKVARELSKFLSESQNTEKADDSSVRKFEGLDGVHFLQEEILNMDKSIIKEIVNIDDARKFIPPMTEGDIKSRIYKKHSIRSVYTSAHGEDSELSKKAAKFLKKRNCKLRGDTIIFKDKIVFVSYRDKPYGIIIEDSEFASTMNELFDTLYQAS